MSITPRPLRATDNDLLGFKASLLPFVQRMNRVYPDDDAPRLAGLLGPWGSGKTSALAFCAEIAQQSEAAGEGYDNVLWLQPLNAWRLGAIGADPRGIVLEHLLACAEDQDPPPQNLVALKEGLASALGKIVFAGAAAATRATLRSALGVDAVELASQEFNRANSGQSEFASLLQTASNLRSLADAYSNLVEGLCKSLGRDRIVLSVDELDRCSPEFTIDFLYGIRHLLQSPRVTVLVAIDREAVSRCFELVYRRDIGAVDSMWFLEKIFDTWTELPRGDPREIIEAFARAHAIKLNAHTLTQICPNPRRIARALRRTENLLVAIESEAYEPQLLQYGAPNIIQLGAAWIFAYTQSPSELDTLLAVESHPHEDKRSTYTRAIKSILNAFNVDLDSPANRGLAEAVPFSLRPILSKPDSVLRRLFSAPIKSPDEPRKGLIQEDAAAAILPVARNFF